MQFRCLWLFCFFVALKFCDLLSHIHIIHSEDPNFSVICGIDGCNAQYAKYNSLHRHISRSYPSWLKRTTNFDQESLEASGGNELNEQLLLPATLSEHLPNAVNVIDDQSNYNHDHGSDFVSNSETVQPVYNLLTNEMPEKPDDALKCSAAVYCLRLKEKNHLPQRAIDSVVAGTRFLFEETIQELKNRILKRLHEAETPRSICDDIEDVCDEIPSPFDGLETEWLQHAYFKDKFGFVEPVAMELGKKMVYRGTGNKRKIVEIKRTFYYVPFLKNLQKLLSKGDILQIMLSTNGYSKYNKLRSFSDGLLCKGHPIFSTNIQALQIVLCHDEIQLSNAVGNHVKTHKLYMFYYVILNLPLKYRTKLEDIHLFAISRSVDVKEYGFDAILEPLLSDIQKLSTHDGYQFTLDDGRYVTLQGALAAYIADTPASHEAAGFKEGVGLAFKKCRHCHATFASMQTNFLEENFDLRYLQEHLHYLHTMSENDDLTQHLGMIYGINRPSILLQFPHFDICEQMPEDIMHVLLEGVIPYTVKLVLHHFITIKKYFSIQELNGKICGFNYAYFNKKYQPNPLRQEDVSINSECHFKQDADQMWLLSSILPFLLDDFIDLEDEYWLLFLMLMEITRISLSPVLSLETISWLKVLIKDFLTSFKTLFVDHNITPKMHYLVHFPRMLLSLGPLVNFWCMRMESKHSYFKSLSGVVGYKNVPFSLAKRHQKLACFHGLNFEQSSNHVGQSKRLTQEEQNRATDRLQRYFSIDPEDVTSIHSCSWAEIDNIKYVPKECVLLVGFDENENPFFCKLETVIYVNVPDHIFFQCQALNTICFNDKLCAYQVEEPNMASGLLLYTKDQLKIHQPLQLIRHKGNTYVHCRFNLEDIIDNDNGQ